jgi:hypothetical protein
LTTHSSYIILIKETNVKVSQKDKLVTTLGMKHWTRIRILNVRTVWEAGKLVQREAAMIRYKTVILGISEACWNSFGGMKTVNENTLIHSGREDAHNDHKECVVLLSNKDARKSLLEWKPLLEKIITARLKIKVTLVQCYPPTETANNEENDMYYGQITHTRFLIHVTAYLP